MDSAPALDLGVSGGHFNYVPKSREQSQAKSEREELKLPSAKRLDKDLGALAADKRSASVPLYIGTYDLNVFCFFYFFGFYLINYIIILTWRYSTNS